MLLVFIITLMIAGTSVALAQTTEKKLFAVVDIVVEDTAMLHDGSIHINMSKNGINSNFASDRDTFGQEIVTAKTRLVIPLTGTVTYGRIDYLNRQQAAQLPLNQNNDLFVFQPGDSVVLHLSNHEKGAFFTGKSADKYNCIYRISNSDEINSVDKYNAYMKLKDFEGAYSYRKFQQDSIYAIQLHILETFKAKLNTDVYNLIKLDCLGNYNQHLADIYLSPFLLQRSEEYQTAGNLFSKHFGNYKEGHFNDTALLVKSYKYSDFLAEKEKVFAIIQNSLNGISYYSKLKFADINKAIDQHYVNGILKDKIKLLAFYNIDRRRQGDFASYINEAIDKAKDDPYKTALIQFRDANTIGADAFPFELPGQNGKLYKLSDFSGKVVVMDFWFTGCHGCVVMAESLKPIVSYYKSNPNIVFVSISIDGNKELWLKSLHEEKYCNTDEINLLAGMDRESSIYKHYNIQECPTLIVISKTGKIISAAPPDPRIDEEAFKALIDKYL
ncbi:TlpA family protein disulfide reductase [Mucilaginibacter gotjawali]|nr:TlpA disulfide reductase family protein [Mucilaginibacter gotjawali]MBB3058278.1 cytochrome oxidase Cu insertion factor (SCO1/SenC/PrrC family) [Mucilaginibacter gotjawali]